MCEILDKYINQGFAEGKKQGKKQGKKIGRKQGEKAGRKQGENLLGTLIICLIKDQRSGDIALAASDEKARKALYKEYGLIPGRS